jgi:protease-4
VLSGEIFMIQRAFLMAGLFCLILTSSPRLAVADDKAEKSAANVAHIRLSGNLDETPVTADPFLGTNPENFKSKIDRIHKAMNDKTVQALLIHVDSVNIGWAKVQEFRKAIEDFRKTGRKAYAYLDSGENKDFLVASGCDVVAMPESGWLVLVGLRAEVSFYKELLEKLGIRADFLQMGVYKFAAEPFTRSKMSPEAKAQYKLVLDDFFDHAIVQSIYQSRSRAKKELTPARVSQIIDEGPFTAKRAADLGLIDHVAYYEEMEDLIKKDLSSSVKIVKDYGSDKVKDIDFSNPFNVLKLFVTPKTGSFRPGKDRIALIYAVGPIMTGKGGSSLFGGQVIGSTSMIEAIRQAENDPKVKAIVLRVDSPGGSALASDLIWRELKRCKKPVVASMSDVAASGGYYISMGAQKVYAQPGTLTGSIGVVGGKLALGGLYDKVGLKTEVLSRGKNAGILSSLHPFSPSEKKAMEALMNEVYDQFLDKVQENRASVGKKFTRKQLIDLAEGRIWTGKQALDRGLVDALGSLEDVIADAKVLGGLSKNTDVDYLILPKPRSFMDTLMEGGSPLGSLSARELSVLGSLPEVGHHARMMEAMLQMRTEPVWVMLPHGIRVR